MSNRVPGVVVGSRSSRWPAHAIVLRRAEVGREPPAEAAIVRRSIRRLPGIQLEHSGDEHPGSWHPRSSISRGRRAASTASRRLRAADELVLFTSPRRNQLQVGPRSDTSLSAARPQDIASVIQCRPNSATTTPVLYWLVVTGLDVSAVGGVVLP